MTHSELSKISDKNNETAVQRATLAGSHKFDSRIEDPGTESIQITEYALKVCVHGSVLQKNMVVRKVRRVRKSAGF